MPVQALVVSAIVFGPLSGWLAGLRHRPRLTWFLLGTLLGPLAPGLLLVAPPGRCPACGAATRGWRRSCLACGRSLTGEPTAADALVAPEPTPPPTTLPAPAPTRLPAHPLGPADTGIAAWRGSSLNEPPAAGRETGREILAAGILVGGSGGLSIGSRYIIAREAAELLILGPVDLDPDAVALRRSRRRLDASVLEGRLLISETARGRLVFALAFTTLALVPDRDVEREIPLSDRRRAVDPPAATVVAEAAEPPAMPETPRTGETQEAVEAIEAAGASEAPEAEVPEAPGAPEAPEEPAAPEPTRPAPPRSTRTAARPDTPKPSASRRATSRAATGTTPGRRSPRRRPERDGP